MSTNEETTASAEPFGCAYGFSRRTETLWVLHPKEGRRMVQRYSVYDSATGSIYDFFIFRNALKWLLQNCGGVYEGLCTCEKHRPVRDVLQELPASLHRSVA